jgi:hypothetical protein
MHLLNNQTAQLSVIHVSKQMVIQLNAERQRMEDHTWDFFHGESNKICKMKIRRKNIIF